MPHVETIRVNGAERALLAVPEACQVLNVGRSRLYTMVGGERPELRSVHVGRSIRIPAGAIREWLERQGAQNHGPEAA